MQLQLWVFALLAVALVVDAGKSKGNKSQAESKSKGSIHAVLGLIEENGEKIDALQSSVQGIQAALEPLGEIESSVAETKAHLMELEAELVPAVQSVAARAAHIQPLREDVADIKAQIGQLDAIQGQLYSISVAVAAVQSGQVDAAALSASLAALASKLNALEGLKEDVASLQAELAHCCNRTCGEENEPPVPDNCQQVNNCSDYQNFSVFKDVDMPTGLPLLMDVDVPSVEACVAECDRIGRCGAVAVYRANGGAVTSCRFIARQFTVACAAQPEDSQVVTTFIRFDDKCSPEVLAMEQCPPRNGVCPPASVQGEGECCVDGDCAFISQKCCDGQCKAV